MIKDLVVNLGLTTDRDAAAEFAISIAETFQAHVAGIAFASLRQPSWTASPLPGSTLSAMKAWPLLKRRSNGSKRLPDAQAHPLSTGCSKQASAPRPPYSAASLGVLIYR